MKTRDDATGMPGETEHVSDRLPGWARGELSGAEGVAVERHLASCAACREEAEAVRLLAGAPLPRLSAAERARALAGIERRRRGSWRSGLWRTAAAVALLLGGVAFWQVALRQAPAEAWSASGVVAAWEEDLAELGVGAEEARLALGVPPVSSDWETAVLRDAWDDDLPAAEGR